MTQHTDFIIVDIIMDLVNNDINEKDAIIRLQELFNTLKDNKNE